MEHSSWYFVIGFLAQGLFSARMFIQWILSEKAKKVVSPTIYWKLSLLGSLLFSIYGWLRSDFAIILGQIFSYYIYIWNLNNKKSWERIPAVIRWSILLLPVIALGCVLYDSTANFDHLFKEVSFGLLVFGSIGQLIFTFRFVYQWLYSRSRGESLLPSGFWTLSLIGSLLILVYGIIRKDPVLLLGQGAGFITYTRNLWLDRKYLK
ncbi:lipid-A-disaccharide synthase N-terminal domain-containing protein [Parabacteroides sp. Marseille-P3160]|uniref:lipid-A-disaccharide synthase N-terminal domain-containing protein n=1 Tax=Parabacteroides sp. Marseille-P3160 TaxID=1917887 RepID=UPI0009BA0124|nr:lipid-A-disaccharide synthase N-terminal domain-containing protein [Parabacteroides sp. Marseille-P3160]